MDEVDDRASVIDFLGKCRERASGAEILILNPSYSPDGIWWFGGSGISL